MDLGFIAALCLALWVIGTSLNQLGWAAISPRIVGGFGIVAGILALLAVF